MNNKLKIILPIILVSSSAFVIFQIKNNSDKYGQTDVSNPKSNQITSTDQITISPVYQKLSVIGNRCIGCGKCVRIDPSHFEMMGNKATVISSKNLDSSNLKLAINNCPASAITLE